MESVKEQLPLQFEKGKIYFIICYALVSGGKSTIFNHMLSLMENEEFAAKYKMFYISSDQLHAKLAEEYQKSHSNVSYEEAFDKTGKSTAKAFDSEVKGFINKKDNNKVNIILLDKNYPNGIGNFMKTFCKNKNNTKVIVFVPKINKALLFEGEITKDGKTEKKNIYYPYSIDYIIQCYIRLSHRQGHETLNGGSEQSRYVFLSFLRLFQGFNFNHQLKNNKKEDCSNVYLREISFTDESKNIPFEGDTLNFFKEVMVPLKAFDFELIKHKFSDEIKTFFDNIEKQYDEKKDGKYFEDTREIIKSEVNALIAECE